MTLFGPKVKNVVFNPVAQAFEGLVRQHTTRGWEEITARAYLPISTPYEQVSKQLLHVAIKRNEALARNPGSNVVSMAR